MECDHELKLKLNKKTFVSCINLIILIIILIIYFRGQYPPTSLEFKVINIVLQLLVFLITIYFIFISLNIGVNFLINYKQKSKNAKHNALMIILNSFFCKTDIILKFLSVAILTSLLFVIYLTKSIFNPLDYIEDVIQYFDLYFFFIFILFLVFYIVLIILIVLPFNFIFPALFPYLNGENYEFAKIEYQQYMISAFLGRKIKWLNIGKVYENVLGVVLDKFAEKTNRSIQYGQLFSKIKHFSYILIVSKTGKEYEALTARPLTKVDFGTRYYKKYRTLTIFQYVSPLFSISI